MNRSSCQPATYSHSPSADTSTPFGRISSLPGTSAQPASVRHSHTPLPISPSMRGAVVANPPPGSAATAFSTAPSGATAQPIQVNAGDGCPASSSNTSIDSRNP